jgi:hypothetical protein
MTGALLVQVKVFDLHGKNYNFTLSPTYQPIAEDNCVAVASKTRKNILITMQVSTASFFQLLRTAVVAMAKTPTATF